MNEHTHLDCHASHLDGALLRAGGDKTQQTPIVEIYAQQFCGGGDAVCMLVE